jgi:hypothetical protein
VLWFSREARARPSPSLRAIPKPHTPPSCERMGILGS